MQTSYIYSVSRANTLKQFLLTKTDIERLLVVESDAELHTALKETYLAPFVAEEKSTVTIPKSFFPLAKELWGNTKNIARKKIQINRIELVLIFLQRIWFLLFYIFRI